MALKYKSFSTLKYLVSEYRLRQSLKNLDIVVRTSDGAEYPFKTLIMPILAKVKDVEALSFLARQDGFVFTAQDLNSFINMALSEKWLQGVKTFLASPSAAFYFTALSFEEQKLMVERIVKFVSNVDDSKTKKTYIQGIIDECLTKRPFNKHLVLTLIEGQLQGSTELAKLARECLKSLTSEDLMHLAFFDA